MIFYFFICKFKKNFVQILCKASYKCLKSLKTFFIMDVLNNKTNTNKITLVKEKGMYIIKYSLNESSSRVYFPCSDENEQEIKLKAENFKQKLKNNLNLEEYIEPIIST